GASEVSSAILTAVATTIVSFIPVFTMEAAEGKLFGPLAFTKTFALVAALIITIVILPTLAHWFFGIRLKNNLMAKGLNVVLIVLGLYIAIFHSLFSGLILMAFGAAWFVRKYSPRQNWVITNLSLIIAVVAVSWLLAEYWLPLGPAQSLLLNFIFVGLLVGLILGFFSLLE